MDANVWAPVVAAIGASALTGFATFGVELRSARRSERAARSARQQTAYAEILTRCALMVNSAGALRLTMQVRSGLKEGVDVTLRQRKPVDPIELNDYIRRDMEPMFAAMAEASVVDSQRAIEVANDLVNQATNVVGVAIEASDARPSLVRFLSGLKWWDADNEDLASEVRKLADLRTAFAEIARLGAGVEAARLVTPRTTAAD